MRGFRWQRCGLLELVDQLMPQEQGSYIGVYQQQKIREFQENFA